MSDAFLEAVNALDADSFQALYGRWDPLTPGQVADLLSAAPVRWWIAGGRAARAGAPARHHEDTDVAVRVDDLDELRTTLASASPGRAHCTPLTPSPICDPRSPCCTRLISTAPRTGQTSARHAWIPRRGPG